MLNNSFGFARNFEGSAICTETAVKWFGVQDSMTAGVNDNALLQNTFYGNGLLATQAGLVKNTISSSMIANPRQWISEKVTFYANHMSKMRQIHLRSYKAGTCHQARNAMSLSRKNS